MSFEPFEHMAWAKRVQPAAALDLAVSGMPSCSWEELGLDPRDLSLAEPNPLGLPRWRRAIAERFGVPEAQVVPVAGASTAIFVATALCVRPGDRVAVEVPGYGALRSVPTLFGACVEPLPRRIENGFHLDPADLAALGRRPPKLLLLSDLHNPTGVALTEEERSGIVQAAEDGGFTVLCDEVYREFLPDDPDPLSRRSARVLSAGSLTKAFGLGTLRAGWILAPEAAAEEIRRLLDLTYVNTASIAEAAAAHALAHLERLRARTQSLLAPRRRLLDGWLDSRPELAAVRSPHVPFAFPALPSGLLGDRLSEALLAERGIAVVPGRFFGSRGHFRISCAGLPAEALGPALGAVSEVIDRLLREPRRSLPGGTV